jgi:hypothetical protein
MKLSPTLVLLLAACAVFILTPYFPGSVLKMTVGNKVGSALLLAAVLYALTVDRIVGLAAFLAVAALFLEQRRRKVDVVRRGADAQEKPAFSVEQLDKPAQNIVPGEVHPERKEADTEDYSFEPTEESGTNKYEDVGDSYDEKKPLETVPPQPSEVSEMFQAKGLSHLN